MFLLPVLFIPGPVRQAAQATELQLVACRSSGLPGVSYRDFEVFPASAIVVADDVVLMREGADTQVLRCRRGRSEPYEDSEFSDADKQAFIDMIEEHMREHEAENLAELERWESASYAHLRPRARALAEELAAIEIEMHRSSLDVDAVVASLSEQLGLAD
ncbi:MAG: hypothetical protein GY913_30870 [Proteobacteria bacterium]|nr:hypothetical protein [Pseudomonadota bacterium]MCP4921320.1 hypothetical protein [Pseudomonadota bacterium]